MLSTLMNFAIGFSFGIIFGLAMLIITGGFISFSTFISFALWFGAFTALLSANIYRIYFYYKLSVDVNSVCKGDGLESENYVIAMVLGVLTFGIYDLYWVSKLAQRMRANAPRYGFKIVPTGKEIAVLNALSFGYAGAAELIQNMNKFANVYNQTGVAEVVGGVQ